MSLIDPGKKAPSFVLYFYPKDDTPGCTRGVARTTYLIGADGKVVQRWDGVKVDGHAEEVLAAVQQL